jgi:hypothetical protein
VRCAVCVSGGNKAIRVSGYQGGECRYAGRTV